MAKCGTGSLSFLGCHPQSKKINPFLSQVKFLVVYNLGELRFFSNPSNAQKILEYNQSTTDNTALLKLQEYKFNMLKDSYLKNIRPGTGCFLALNLLQFIFNHFLNHEKAADDEILIETSPQYAMSSDKKFDQKTTMENRRIEIQAMKALNPKIKVMVVLCDPIKRAFSGIK